MAACKIEKPCHLLWKTVGSNAVLHDFYKMGQTCRNTFILSNINSYGLGLSFHGNWRCYPALLLWNGRCLPALVQQRQEVYTEDFNSLLGLHPYAHSPSATNLSNKNIIQSIYIYTYTLHIQRQRLVVKFQLVPEVHIIKRLEDSQTSTGLVKRRDSNSRVQ